MMRGSVPNVVVLAGGSNSRFWPLRAKSLLSFCGRTLLERHINGFLMAGCQRFVVVANPETVEEVRRVVAPLRATVMVVVQEEPRGMGDALLTAVKHFPSLEREPMIVSQAHDVVKPALFAELLNAATASGADGLLAAQRVKEPFPGAYLTLNGTRVTGLVEKPPPGSEPSDMVTMVVHLHQRSAQLMEEIRSAYAGPDQSDDHYERAVAALLPHCRYLAVPYDGPWRAMKYPWQVLGAMEVILSEITPTRPAPEGVTGAVAIEESARILPGARVVGPAWIGSGSVIGTNSLVRGSIIGRNVEVGFGCEIARSYVADGCTFHHNYVGDSVIDRNAGFGFGTVTGNWPFYPPPVRSTAGDERLKTGMDKFGAVVGADSRTGIGVLLNPGVKIGARSFVGPGIVLNRDVPDGRLLLMKQDLTDQANPFR